MNEETGVPGAGPADAPDEEREPRGDAEASAHAADAHAEAEALRDQARALAEEHARATRDIAALRSQLDAAAELSRSGVERYREALLRAEPLLPPELITGDSFDELDAAAAGVRALVQRISDSVAREGRAPAGAPPRRAPDTAGMSAEEKIRAGLSQRRA